MNVVLALILIMAAAGFWIVFIPIHWRAIKTSRLLARGVVYDRQSTPIRFWFGLFSVARIRLIMMLLAAGYVIWLIR
jgi:hypothetical protein